MDEQVQVELQIPELHKNMDLLIPLRISGERLLEILSGVCFGSNRKAVLVSDWPVTRIHGERTLSELGVSNGCRLILWRTGGRMQG